MKTPLISPTIIVLVITASNWAPVMPPDENDSQNEPKPEKKTWELIKEGSVIQTLRWGGGSLKKIFCGPSGLNLAYK